MKQPRSRIHSPRKAPKTPKHLNIIYYFDSQKTKSFRVSVPVAILGLTTLVGLFIWVIVSPFLIIEANQAMRKKDQKISRLLTSIFDYQTRYEGVFEKAYPPSQEYPLSSSNSEESLVQDKSSSDGLDVKATASTKSEQTINDQEKEQAPMDKPSPESQAVKAEIPREEFAVHIEKPKARLYGDTLEVDLSLKNLANPKKTGGWIAGVATFELENGDKKLIATPEGNQLSTAGRPENLKHTISFSIRYYKAKRLIFKKPSSPGKFVKLEIYAGKGRDIEKTFSFPLDLKVASPLPKENDKPEVPVEKANQDALSPSDQDSNSNTIENENGANNSPTIYDLTSHGGVILSKGTINEANCAPKCML